MRDYNEVIEYLYRQLPMYQRIGKQAFKKDLTNIHRLCTLLDHPEEKFQSIHIAGTNGKGSTSHILSACLQSLGLKIGLYTSPHYIDFRERIKINGKEIPKEEVIEFVDTYKDSFEKVKPSFFEWSVALAFYYFSKESVDLAIIETGLGGRLDSTNVITPLLSVITNVDFDHMDQLGHTKPLIAKEKAGIIKSEVPALLGEKDEEYLFVMEETAAKNNSPLYFATDICTVTEEKDELEYTEYLISYDHQKFQQRSDIGGGYQTHNIRTSIAALHCLKQYWPHLNINVTDTLQALSSVRENTNLLGRWQVLGASPPLILDGAHNHQSLWSVIERFKTIDAEVRHIVIGLSEDKDLDDLLNILPDFAVYYFCKANVPRGMPATLLSKRAKEFGLKGKAYPTVEAALENALENASDFDALLVTGSIFIVGEVLSINVKK